MQDPRAARRGRAPSVRQWMAATAAVIGMLCAGLAFYAASGGNASVAEGPSGAAGASKNGRGKEAMTTETTPRAAAARPPMDATPTAAVETATFALG